jgi:NAD(P)-dependent dehydrogenase (short-subunit alcohol dehydrogenase family)
MTDSRKKTALVTGASSGMGKEIAKQLIADGFCVYVAARRVEKMADLAQLGARVLELDIANEDQIQRAAGTILAEAVGVDVLVNNAGFGLYGAVEDVPTDEARHQFEVNVFGPARLTQLLLPAMRERGSGTIVNITSMGGKMYTPLGAWYHASKHALEGWSDCLRLELAPFGIRVVIVEPGLIETEFGEVVSEGMLARSDQGAYEALTRAVTRSTQAAYGHGKTTPASVIAKVVSKAVKAARPRTRYVAGAFARPMLFIRKWFGDRLFDRMIMSQVN